MYLQLFHQEVHFIKYITLGEMYLVEFVWCEMLDRCVCCLLLLCNQTKIVPVAFFFFFFNTHTKYTTSYFYTPKYLMMPKSSVGLLVQSGALDNLVGPVR